MFSEAQYYELYIFSHLYILLVYELGKGVFDGWGGSHGGAHGKWLRKRYEKRETRYAAVVDPQNATENYIQILFLFLQFILYNVCIKRNLYS